MGKFVDKAMDCANAVTNSTSALELIECQARATPDAIAVTSGTQALAYRQLDDRSMHLAALLRSHGVGTEARVGICLKRSPALAVAAVAVWKAGGAFVPLDPGDPANRIVMLLEDSEAEVLVTNRRTAELLPAGRWTTVVLDEDGSLPIDLQPTDRPADLRTDRVGPEDLAYVIFTSGSTGRPKGVQITHANLLNLIRWHVRAFGVTASDRATMQASPGFDAAVWELFPYLCVGASVFTIDDSMRATPALLRDWMVANGISISFVPTAVAESLIALSWPPDTKLRFLLTGADVLRRYPPRGLPFVLVNNYGPTECTVVATSGVVPPGDQSNSLPNIGRPIDNVQIYVVDEGMNQVPQGASGELLIGGAGVGRGYLNLPELNAKKFIQNPFSSEGGGLYRTGDLARVLPDGQIAFLGRIDEQVKVRGYRIEPGEISAILDRHRAVESSLVTVQTGTADDTRLVAYIVDKESPGASASELRSWLTDRLPIYMVPATFVRIDQIPITTHGKVDRSALPPPTPENCLPEDSFQAPQSEVERWLAGYLIRLLRIPEISRHDNFFGLGGHSLMGAQLIAEIQRSYGVELSLRNLFDHPTVAGIAAEIETLIQAQLNAMSDDEAQRLLESVSGRGSV